MNATKILRLNLQLFADGGAGGAAGAGEGAASGDTSQAAAVDTGADAQAAAEKRAADWKKAKADFKAEYDSEVQGIMRERLKTAKDNEKAAKEYRDKTSKIFDALSVKYGIDADKIDDIVAEVEKDNSYYENEALKRGMDVAELRRVRQVERENAQMKAEKDAAQQREAAQQRYQALLRQVDDVKAVYPSFDFEAESEANPLFRKLCALGIPVRNAYESTHMEEIMAKGMQYAAQQTAANVQATAAKNKSRPAENGLGSKSQADGKVDIGKLSLAEMQKMNEEARRGKKITFT